MLSFADSADRLLAAAYTASFEGDGRLESRGLTKDSRDSAAGREADVGTEGSLRTVSYGRGELREAVDAMEPEPSESWNKVGIHWKNLFVYFSDSEVSCNIYVKLEP